MKKSAYSIIFSFLLLASAFFLQSNMVSAVLWIDETGPPTLDAPGSDFVDVTAEDVNYSAIKYLSSKGFIKGYDDGTYRAWKPINRAEFATILIKARFDQNIIDNCISPLFPDVPSQAWFAKYVCVARKENIMRGYPNGNFAPSQPINVAEATAVMVRVFEDEVTPNNKVWYLPFIEKLLEKNAIPVTLQSASQQVTRGEMAEMMYRLMESLTDKTPVHPNIFDFLCYQDEYYHFQCAGSGKFSSQLSLFSCDYFIKSSESLKDLEPYYPIVECIKIEQEDKQGTEGVVRSFGWGWTWNVVYVSNYVIFKDNAFTLLASEDAFKKMFVPINSPQEVFAYITAFKKGYFIFNTAGILDLEKGLLKVEKSKIKPTEIQELKEGFRINVFSIDEDMIHAGAPCTDVIFETIFFVTKEGEIEKESSQLIWERIEKPDCIA